MDGSLRIRVPLSLRAAVERRAAMEDRSLAAMLRRLIKEGLIASGGLSPDRPRVESGTPRAAA
jgi:hypothetical protein